MEMVEPGQSWLFCLLALADPLPLILQVVKILF